MLRDQRHKLITVDPAAFFVGHNKAVSVTIQCNADIGLMFDHHVLHELRMGRTALIVDVAAIGRDSDRDNIRA